jgi:uncharacterized protein (TIGR03546 family)
MLTLLKLLQSIFKALHSEGTPGQVASGIVLGACLGLTPLLNVHNLIIIVLLALLNVSFGGGMLGLALCTPIGFALDPLFDKIGLALLHAPGLESMWTAWFNTPLVPYTNFNNSVVLGSLVFWLVAAVPLFFLAQIGVKKYRSTYGERFERSRFYKAVTASKLYNVYRWFQPES